MANQQVHPEISKVMGYNRQLWRHVRFDRAVVSSAAELWIRACEYFQWCDDNPITSMRTINTGQMAGKKVEEEYCRPYLIKALCLFCGIHEDFLKDMRNNSKVDSEMYNVVSTILYVVWVQNVEYASVGIINPTFTQKVLGMDTPDTRPSNITISVVEGLTKLSRSESEILESLNLENGQVVKTA